jgi:hypothetical protein
MPTMKKAAAKKSDPSKTKPFNVQLIKPGELVKDKFATKKPAPKTTTKATPKPTKSPAQTMTPQDKAMLNILRKKYGKDVYKG